MKGLIISPFRLGRKFVFLCTLELEVLLTNIKIPKKLPNQAHQGNQGKFWESSIRSIMGTTYWFVSPYCSQHNAATALIPLYTTSDSFFRVGFTCCKIRTAKPEKNWRWEFCRVLCVASWQPSLYRRVEIARENIGLNSIGLLLIISQSVQQKSWAKLLRKQIELSQLTKAHQSPFWKAIFKSIKFSGRNGRYNGSHSR